MNIVPYPRRLIPGEGSFSLPTTAVCSADLHAAVAVNHKLACLGFSVAHTDPTPFTVVVGRQAAKPPPAHAEGYSLIVSPSGIAVRGRDRDGLFWGLTTLEQLLDGARECPCCEIVDWPAFAVRGHHDDISRKQVSTVEDFQRIIRLLSFFKLNHYTLYIEDMLHLPSFPAIGEGRGKLLPGEVKTIRETARKYNVNLFPSYSLIGHQENLLADFRFEHLGKAVFQSKSSFDPENLAVRRFLEIVIREVCESFPDTELFNACFDETQGIGEQALIDHANWCAEQLAGHGKRMLMWADMFKNHFGLDKLKKLSANITPIEWCYGDPTAAEADYRRAGITPLGYAGYNNWCVFLPDNRPGKQNIDRWAGMMKRLGGRGWIASMWGDNGYENARDLAWNLFAYNGERAWCGQTDAPVDFEPRFNAVFYGAPMTDLDAVRALPEKRRVPARDYWRNFRETMPHLIRRATTDPEFVAAYREDLAGMDEAIDAIERLQQEAGREKEHLNHYRCALLRERNIARRVLLAGDLAAGLTDAERCRRLDAELTDLETTRRYYRDCWLQNNKKPNIEVSLAVYDVVAESLRELRRPEPPSDPGYIEADMAVLANTFFAPVAGIPLGRKRIHGIPFSFAPADRTHCRLVPGEGISFSFPTAEIADIHFIYGGQTLEHKDFRDSLEVVLLRDQRPVFSETLRNIRDIVCWWAPLGEHMWAGGGYRHCNQERNTWALRPAPYYGLMRFSGFALGDGVRADELRLQAVGAEAFALFALTLEKTIRSAY